MPEKFLDESISGSAWAAEASGNVMFAFYDRDKWRVVRIARCCAERWLRPFLPRV
jgi:hypothetical protein